MTSQRGEVSVLFWGGGGQCWLRTSSGSNPNY